MYGWGEVGGGGYITLYTATTYSVAVYKVMKSTFTSSDEHIDALLIIIQQSIYIEQCTRYVWYLKYIWMPIHLYLYLILYAGLFK